MPGAAVGQEGLVNRQHEYNVKAAFLYSFGRYVNWPASAFNAANPEFVVGVLGNGPVRPVLDQIAKTKQMQGRKVRIVYLNQETEAANCHLVFVSEDTPAERRAAVLKAVSGRPVLLVGETQAFAQEGADIVFLVESETVRFSLNVVGAKAKGLSFEAKLLSIAKTSQP